MKRRTQAFLQGALSIDRALEHHTLNRHNNFNLLRAIAALAVLYSHCYALTGSPTEPLQTTLGFPISHIAVDTFFVISGFLVATSLIKSGNVKVYLLSRVIRIYPALIVAALFCVCLVGPLFTRLSLRDYFSDPLTFSHWVHNSTAVLGLKFKLPGVFGDNIYPDAVNGSLWTLRWEIRLYLVLAVLGWLHFRWPKLLGIARFKNTLLGIAVVLMTAYLLKHFMPAAMEGGDKTVHLGGMFFYGAALFCFQDRVVLSVRGLAITLGLMTLAAGNTHAFFVAYNLGLGYLVLCLAYLPGGIIRRFNAVGDYSYGIYIYAFPVQQSLIALFPGTTPMELLMSATPVTLLLAGLSWHLLEKPALRIKKRWKPHPLTL